MTPDECKNLDELIATLVKYHPEANVELVEKAYHFAEKAHAGQLRKSGEPYFVHPLTVAGILAKLMLDAPTIAAQSVALPGTSEHQLGLALDLISETYTNHDQWQERTEVQQWLMQNCWRYGFILRYPNGTSETTGIIYEPWHYRYVGSETAKAVAESGLVFEDYLKTLESE